MIMKGLPRETYKLFIVMFCYCLLVYYYTPAKRMFLGVYWNQLDCPSVCVQNLVCQSTGRGIDSHLVTALDVFVIHKNIVKLALKCLIHDLTLSNFQITQPQWRKYRQLVWWIQNSSY